MRKYLLWSGILFVMLTILCGCGQPVMNEVNLNQEFTLSTGQSAAVSGEDFTVKFVEVISDSRCPTGATCIWAGEASCLLEITKSQSTFSKMLTQPGLSTASKGSFADYEITFDIQPYPQLGKEIGKNDYRLQLIINKKQPLNGGILVTFDVVGEKYSIFITNTDTIEQVLSLQRGESQAVIPSGRLVRGSVPYNQHWSWHIDSEDIHMAEITIELCDGTPSQVEANLDYWVDTVQRFCPWDARIVKIEDFR
jgi:hypothetical protein